MSTVASEVKVKTISTEELKQLLDSKRPVEFWNVLTNEYFKGENIAGSRRVRWAGYGNGSASPPGWRRMRKSWSIAPDRTARRAAWRPRSWRSSVTTTHLRTKAGWKSGRPLGMQSKRCKLRASGEWRALMALLTFPRADLFSRTAGEDEWKTRETRNRRSRRCCGWPSALCF